MSSELRIVLFGASGRMGKHVIEAAKQLSSTGEKVTVLGGVIAPEEPLVGKSVDGVSLPLSSGWVGDYEAADVLIDFSLPSGTKLALEAVRSSGKPAVICTTGLGAEFEEYFVRAAKVAPVVRTRNTSVGINALLRIVGETARLLGSDFDVELVELHHRWKRDAPSGTANALVEEVARAKGLLPDKVVVCGRSGMTDGRGEEEVGVQAVRGGDVAGEHTVYFLGLGERLELTHRAASPAVFAYGAIRAATWLKKGVSRQLSPGIYSMLDVIESGSERCACVS